MLNHENTVNVPGSSLRFLLPILLFLSASSALMAQSYDDDFASGYFGIRAGFITLEDVDESGSLNWGLFGGAFLTPFLALEASVDHQEGDINVGGDYWSVDIPLLERETTALQVGLKLIPIVNSPIRPYLSAGLGYYASDYVDLSGYYDYYSENIDEGGYYAGGGIDFLGDRSNARGFSLTFDTRWLFTNKETFRENYVRADGWATSFGCSFKF